MKAVEVSQVSKSFGATQAVREVSFAVERGEIFGLLGPNGAGKTTAIRLILDVLRPDHGTVSVLGGPMSADKLDLIGYMPEERGLYQDLPLERCLVYLATLKGVPRDVAQERLAPLLERFELDAHRRKKVKQLSKGMQQKAQVIHTILHEPQLVVVDEPFAGLDPLNTQLVKELLGELRDRGAAVLMSTHQLHRVEELCDRIALIDRGEVVLYGRIDEIRRRFGGDFLTVRAAGPLPSLAGTEVISSNGEERRLRLLEGTSARDVLRELVSAEVAVEGFELDLPSLDEVFIRVVQEGARLMRELLLVARHEYARHILSRSFLLVALFVPLVITVAVIVEAVTSGDADEVVPLGVVDPGAILGARALPPELRLFSSEHEARAALEAGAIGGIAHVPASWPEPHEVGLTCLEAPERSTLRALRDQLREHLLAGRPAIDAEGPRITFRTPDGGREYSGPVTGGMVLPPLSGLFLLLLIFLGSGQLTSAVVEEKANRTLEVLATALPAGQLMAGKILGIVAATLTLLLVWIAAAIGGAAAGGLAFGGEWLQSLRPDPMAMLLMVALIVPAYCLVAAGLTAVGAALTEARVGQQVTMVLMATLMGTVSLTMPLMEDPASPTAVALSLTPIFSTVLLPARNLFMAVPAWQVVVAVGVQLACAAGALWLAGRALRMGTARFGGGVDWRELFGLERARAVAARAAPTRRAKRASAPGRKRSKTWQVARHEAWTMLTRPLFLGMTLGLPLLLAVQMALFESASSRRSGDAPAALPETAALERDSGDAGVHGYVDPTGVIRALPDDIPADRLRAFPDEPSAARALAAGEVIAYSLIPSDYLESGALVVVRPDASPLLGRAAAGPLPWVLLVNTLDGDAQLAARVRQPVEWIARPLAAPAPPTEAAARDADDSSEDEVVAMLSMLLLYGVVLLASGLLMRSVSDEKKNRTMELLLVSISPRQMLTGKLIGLGFVGLVQAAVWTACFVGGLIVSGATSSLPAGFDLGPAIVVQGVLLFLFGYAVYAGLMASAGALVPDVDEARGVGFLMVVPALIGFVAAQFQMDAPHGAVMTGLSLFPLTAPFVMMLRLTVGGVPAWQLALALLLMAATSVVILRATARMFRAQHLLSGQPFSLARYFAALRDARQ